MEQNTKYEAHRVLLLIIAPKLAQKAAAIFEEEHIPLLYQWHAIGTAPSETLDILGLGSPDKSVLATILPKSSANEMLVKINKGLKLRTAGSGIAFTMPLSGVSKLVLRMLEPFSKQDENLPERKGETKMSENKYSLVAAVVNQGYSEEVMDAAREAGAGGGTILHSRQQGNKETVGLWGMGIQEEKEILFIVAPQEKKLEIMQAVSKKCGIGSEAKGIVVSLPVESVMGLDDN